MRYFLHFVTITILLTSSCCKNEEPLSMPPLTFKGADTFGCYINEELFVAQKRDGFILGYNFPATSSILFTKDTNMLFIEGYNWNTSDFINLELRMLSIDTGTFVLNRPTRDSYYYPDINHPNNGALCVKKFSDENYSTHYTTNEFYTGQCKILKIDTAAKIVSGTFEFMAIGDSSDVNVTEGRFDLKLEIN